MNIATSNLSLLATSMMWQREAASWNHTIWVQIPVLILTTNKSARSLHHYLAEFSQLHFWELNMFALVMPWKQEKHVVGARKMFIFLRNYVVTEWLYKRYDIQDTHIWVQKGRITCFLETILNLTLDILLCQGRKKIKHTNWGKIPPPTCSQTPQWYKVQSSLGARCTGSLITGHRSPWVTECSTIPVLQFLLGPAFKALGPSSIGSTILPPPLKTENCLWIKGKYLSCFPQRHAVP